MSKKSILNSLGKYLLFGSLLTGVGYSAVEAQTTEQSVGLGAKVYEILFGKTYKISKSEGKVNPIYANEELTVAGNGVFLTSYVNPSMASDNGSYDLTRKFSSKDKISYHALTSKKIKEILNNSSVAASVKNHINAIQKKIGRNSRENHSRFEKALKDGELTRGELQNIGEGIYAYLVTTGNQAVVGFFEVVRSKAGGLEKKAGEITKESQLPSMGYAPKVDSLSYKTPEDSAKVMEQKVKRDSVNVLKEKAKLDSIQVEEQKIRREEAKKEGMKDIIKFEEKMLERGRVKLKKDTAITEIYEKKKEKPLEKVVSKKEKEIEKLYTRFGLEAEIGTNDEATLGGFVKVPLNSWLSLEGYGDYFVRRGKSTYSDLGTSITQREKQLISSAKYKQRTDDLHTTAEERAIADIGAGISFKINNDIEFPLRIGAGLLKEEKTLDGKSTITFEENGQLLQEPSVITNTKKENPTTKGALSWSAGTRINITKSLSVGASFNKIGRKNSGRLNLRVAF